MLLCGEFKMPPWHKPEVIKKEDPDGFLMATFDNAAQILSVSVAKEVTLPQKIPEGPHTLDDILHTFEKSDIDISEFIANHTVTALTEKNEKQQAIGRTFTIKSPTECLFVLKDTDSMPVISKAAADTVGTNLIRGNPKNWATDTTTNTMIHSSKNLRVVHRFDIQNLASRLAHNPH